MISLDTNLLFYAIDPVAAEKYQLAQRILVDIDPFGSFILLQTLGELCFSVGRKRPALLQDAFDMAQAMSSSFDTVSCSVADLHTAISAQRQHDLQFWDAMLWATAQRNGCTLLLSEDFQDGRTLGSVTFRNPFTMTAEELDELLAN